VASRRRFFRTFRAFLERVNYCVLRAAFGWKQKSMTRLSGEQDVISKLEFKTTWGSLAVQANYRPTALAKLCGVSLRTLEGHFQRGYGMTPEAWLKSARPAAQRRKAGSNTVRPVF
jgi:hypothetical protein